ncbi:hypothetical protein, partial [Sphingomonas abaci]
RRHDAAPVSATVPHLWLAHHLVSKVEKTGRLLGLHTPSPITILLELYLAQEEALSPCARGLGRVDLAHPAVTRRWIAVLESEGLVEQQQGRFSLSPAGHGRVSEMLELLSDVQRYLD